ncbi:hypothetical protein CPLU01_08828 [Colletotrichum plurivorum]|uniref:Uncharacterized protein n=1 Tax=Colletotrichum plurivorum TaxID=2175906 RepID=A0A8H6KAN6_9PEZI|nr:hypothetical protein CPLU01_08828 [Colletotrichum plurivorum]
MARGVGVPTGLSLGGINPLSAVIVGRSYPQDTRNSTMPVVIKLTTLSFNFAFDNLDTPPTPPYLVVLRASSMHRRESPSTPTASPSRRVSPKSLKPVVDLTGPAVEGTTRPPPRSRGSTPSFRVVLQHDIGQ